MTLHGGGPGFVRGRVHNGTLRMVPPTRSNSLGSIVRENRWEHWVMLAKY